MHLPATARRRAGAPLERRRVVVCVEALARRTAHGRDGWGCPSCPSLDSAPGSWRLWGFAIIDERTLVHLGRMPLHMADSQ